MGGKEDLTQAIDGNTKEDFSITKAKQPTLHDAFIKSKCPDLYVLIG
jgi:hypothetical protein